MWRIMAKLFGIRGMKMLKSKKRFVSFMAAMAVCTGLLPMNSIKAYAEVNQG